MENPFPVLFVLIMFAVAIAYHMRQEKVRRELGERMINPPIEQGEILRYHRCVGSTDGIVFSFALTDRAVHVVGQRFSLSDIQYAGLVPLSQPRYGKWCAMFLAVVGLCCTVAYWLTDLSVGESLLYFVVWVPIVLFVYAQLVGNQHRERNTLAVNLVIQPRTGKALKYGYNAAAGHYSEDLCAELLHAIEEAGALLNHISVPPPP